MNTIRPTQDCGLVRCNGEKKLHCDMRQFVYLRALTRISSKVSGISGIV